MLCRFAAAAAKCSSSSARPVCDADDCLPSLCHHCAELLQQYSFKQRQQLRVGPGERFASIGEAVEAAPPGADITVCGGRYVERLVLDKPLTIAAAAGESVEVSWSSGEPYQAAIEVLANGVTLRGLCVRHRSPSIANNAAVRLVGADALLEGLDVCSSTGSGVEVEGGAPRLVRCSAHDCERHGFAIFGAIDGGGCTALAEGCDAAGNKLDGCLVRDGATPQLKRCRFSHNGGYGLELRDCGGVVLQCAIVANQRGSISVNRLVYEELDTAQLPVLNSLDRPVVLAAR